MTRKEIAELLQVIRAAYPNTKINDPGRMIQAWELAFGADDPEVIYRAARYHMRINKFFPTVADIEKSKKKGDLLYKDILPEDDVRSLAPYSVDVSADIISPANLSFCDLCCLCDEKNQEQCPF